MGDCLQTGRPSRYITNQKAQLSLPTIQGRQIKYWPAWLGLRWNAFIASSGDETLTKNGNKMRKNSAILETALSYVRKHFNAAVSRYN